MYDKIALASSASLLAAYIFFSSDAGSSGQQPESKTPSHAAPQTIPEGLSSQEHDNIRLFEKASPSVVYVANLKSRRSGFFSNETVQIPTGTGSGIVWDTQGHIITNSHVIDGADRFLISFKDDPQQYEARVVGIATSSDIAVLKLDKAPANLIPIQLGHSAQLRVGQRAVAIGNPFGFDHTMTDGIVSALGRSLTGFGGIEIRDMIQTDAPINPGNSGGALLDSQGRLMGMNTMIYSNSGSSAGIGFAVPVDTLARIVPQLIDHGHEIRPILGVILLPDQYRRRFGIEKGLVIHSVPENGPAAKAGLIGITEDHYRFYLGDLITHINGKEVNSHSDLYHALSTHKPGDSVKVTIRRQGKTLVQDVILGKN